jgi:hypothetical protein
LFIAESAIAFTLSLTKLVDLSERDIIDWSDTLPDYPSRVEFKETLWGFGYTTESTPVRLALAIILAYCITTIVYLIYIIITDSSSTVWNSAIELVALALQSMKPDYPGQIGVGIDSLDTFKQGVGIRVNKDDGLELILASNRDIESRGLSKIKRNMVY